jgi:hypothetical protein
VARRETVRFVSALSEPFGQFFSGNDDFGSSCARILKPQRVAVLSLTA